MKAGCSVKCSYMLTCATPISRHKPEVCLVFTNPVNLVTSSQGTIQIPLSDSCLKSQQSLSNQGEIGFVFASQSEAVFSTLRSVRRSI